MYTGPDSILIRLLNIPGTMLLEQFHVIFPFILKNSCIFGYPDYNFLIIHLNNKRSVNLTADSYKNIKII